MPGSNTHSTVYDDENHQQQPEGQTIGATETTTTTPPEQTDGGVSSYDEIIDNIKKEIAKNEKQYNEDRKIDAVVAAINGIGDMGRALGNIYATTQYAPSAFDPSTAASGKYGAIAAKAKADHDKYRSSMMKYLDKAKEQKQIFNFNQEKQKQQDAYNKRRMELEEDKERRMQGQYELKANQLKWEQDIKNRTLDLKETELELKRMVAEKKISLEEAKLEFRRVQKANEDYDTEWVYEYDGLGNVVRKTKQKKAGSTTTETPNGEKGSSKKTADLGSNRKTAAL